MPPPLRSPAEEVKDGPYEMRALVAPVLTGWACQAFLNVLEGPLGAYIHPKLARDSGMPQVLQDVHYPEEPLFSGVPNEWPDAEPGVNTLEEGQDADRLGTALACLPSAEQAPPSARDAGSRPTALDYHNAYLSGTTTPSQVADRIIAFMEQHEPSLHWFVAWDKDAIRAQAAASTARYAAKAPLSVLDGVPFAVKDCLDALPHETTAGCTFFAATRPVHEDAPPVAAMKRQGAVCLGKTSMQEFGLHPYGLNARQGVSGNPHDTSRFAGGSSTGSAAAVAAGLCPFAFGTDGGGSIRIPAALCGVVGLKPTNGRMTRDGICPIDNTVASSGPIAGSVTDALLMYAVTANVGQSFAGDKGRPPPLALLQALLPAGDKPLEGLRIGVYLPWFDDGSPEVVAACHAALQHLQALGASLHTGLELPELEELRVAHIATIVSEIYASKVWTTADQGLKAQLSLDTRASLASGRFFEARDYVNAQRIRRRASVHFTRAFGQVDVIATPAVPIVAPVIPPGARYAGMLNLGLSGQLIRFCQPGNFLGYPGIAVPVGVDGQSLPIGLQLMGRPWHEATLLRAAAALEADLHRLEASDTSGVGPVPLPPLYIDPLSAK